MDFGSNTRAHAINDTGQVVGLSNVGLYHQVGPDAETFIYGDGQMKPFTLPGAVPSSINDSGWVVANNPTLNHAYVLEPSTVSVQPTGLNFGQQAVGGATSSNASCGVCAVTVTNGTAAILALVFRRSWVRFHRLLPHAAPYWLPARPALSICVTSRRRWIQPWER